MDIFKELIEIDTTDAEGNVTNAAAASRAPVPRVTGPKLGQRRHALPMADENLNRDETRS